MYPITEDVIEEFHDLRPNLSKRSLATIRTITTMINEAYQKGLDDGLTAGFNAGFNAAKESEA